MIRDSSPSGRAPSGREVETISLRWTATRGANSRVSATSARGRARRESSVEHDYMTIFRPRREVTRKFYGAAVVLTAFAAVAFAVWYTSSGRAPPGGAANPAVASQAFLIGVVAVVTAIVAWSTALRSRKHSDLQSHRCFSTTVLISRLLLLGGFCLEFRQVMGLVITARSETSVSSLLTLSREPRVSATLAP